jgi:hypothetical protein
MKIALKTLLLLAFAIPVAAQSPPPALLTNLAAKRVQTTLKTAFSCTGFNQAGPAGDPQCTATTAR